MNNSTNNPNRTDNDKNPANRDPITGASGSHPVGTGIGAAGGGAAGAAIGAIGGPIGAVAGAAIGAVAGGLMGKGAAEAIDPTVEDEYWQKNYASRPYASGAQYMEYQPAYRYGWENASKQRGRSFDEAAPELERDWTRARGNSNLGWDRAKDAARDAWDRVTPGDRGRGR